MTKDSRAEHVTSAVVAASAELLEGLNAAASPLRVVADSLAGLAATLGVDQVMVAIDDAQYGRQVFCSGRAPLGDGGELLWGPPRLRTDPPRTIDEPLARLIVAAVTTIFERARTGTVEHARTGQPLVPRTDDLINGLRSAVERSARYGWGFTLVLMRLDLGDDETPNRVRAQLRASDTLIELGPRDVGILLAAAAGDEVPAVLARVGRSGTVSTFCYGLATCPGDSADAGDLLALATARLRDAESSRSEPEIHALEPPGV